MKKENIKNIFVSHYHEDAESIKKLQDLVIRNGLTMKDSSIYESKLENNAHNEDYIKQLIKPHIDWAGTMIVLIGSKTATSDWVEWEIKYAMDHDKRIVGVYMNGEHDADIPEALIKYGNALCGWNSEKIIAAINGEDMWIGPSRSPWITVRGIC